MFTPPETTDSSFNGENLDETPENEIHTMPEKFLGLEPQKTGHLSWVILGIALFIGLAGIIIAVIMFLNRSAAPAVNTSVNEPIVNSANNSSVPVVNQETPSTTVPTILATASLRDNKRLEDMSALKTALNLYFKTYQSFPETLNRLSGEFISAVPVNPADNVTPYVYAPTTDGKDYTLNFTLEEGGYWGVTKLSSGAYFVNVTGVVPGTAEMPTNTNEAVPEAPSNEPFVLSKGLDSDGDQLTDIEENLYKTDSTMADTDNDGYIDSSEILTHYDPLKPNARLIDSGLVSIYRNPSYPYSTFYPTAWSARSLTDDDSEVIFTASTGEFIEILVQKNSLGLSLYNWYSAQYKGADVSALKPVTVAGLSALQTADGLTTFLGYGSNIYVLTYNVGAQQQMNFYTTYSLFLKSFIFVQNSVVTPPATVSSTTPAQ
jgi:hypothetical protein